MTVYQELQLNQEGSKRLIRAAKETKERKRHTAIYLLKVFLTIAFCMAFVISYSMVFGENNSIAGVVVLLCVMVFRFADFGIKTEHSIVAMGVIFVILAVGPRMANAAGIFPEFLIHLVCIFLLMILGCHNVIMFNHSTLVLGYLLLYGYDVTGKEYLLRLAGLTFGAVLTGIVYFRNHRKKTYKRGIRELLQEFSPFSSRTRWQLSVTFGVSSALLLAGIFRIPRAMWIGIAVMSVMMPFGKDVKKRVKGRIPGNLGGGVVFLVLYFLLPESMHSMIGILGGIGVGFSATYGWQAVFNSIGAMSIATGILGLPGAVFFRIFNNAFGALYGMAVHRLFQRSLGIAGEAGAE